MPTYDYECQTCEHPFDIFMEMSDYDIKAMPPCPECGVKKEVIRVFTTPPMVNFSGDGWSTKDGRINSQMAENRKRAGAKQHELKMDGAVPTLAPNVGGERTDSWSDAAKLAKSQGKNTSGYEKHARKEKDSSA